ncbi:MAG: hypothetical protein ABIJ56_04340 [Pseudomonadota bacterium]
MTAHKPTLVPASLQRVRCFMNARGRMNVKPWTSAAETLDAFHDMLVAGRRDDGFWKGMETLLETLSADMKKRLTARGEIIDNEVLDTTRHHALLEEIRSCLDGRGGERGRFRRLASALSIPAMGLLFILGGAATTGCYDSSDLVGDGETDGDVAHEADAAQDPDIDPDPDPDPDPDLEPECVPGDRTLEEMIVECVEDEAQLTYYLECIDALNESWRIGLRDLFACKDCYEVHHYLYDCLWRACDDPAAAGEFDLEEFLDNCMMPVYLGVRFE